MLYELEGWFQVLVPTPIFLLLDFSWKDLKNQNKDSEFSQQLFGQRRHEIACTIFLTLRSLLLLCSANFTLRIQSVIILPLSLKQNSIS